MRLLRKISPIFSRRDFLLLKSLMIQPINFQSAVFKQIKWSITLLLLGIGFFGISCTSSTQDKILTEVENVQPQATANLRESPANATPSKYVVTIKDMKYDPVLIQANIGDTVLFINKDLVPHNVADSLTNEWLSPQLAFGDEWTMIVANDLHYYCAFHPNMEGTIQVETPLSAQKSK